VAVNIRTRAGVSDYLDSLRPIRPGGLIFGFRRPAPATTCPDAAGILQRLVAALRQGLAGGEKGIVLCSPVDVVLDEKKALVLHPSAAVVFANRCGIVQSTERLWGAPNVVMELLWSATARHTRCAKVRWYRASGVEECWLLDTRRRRVEVLEFHGASRHVPIIYEGRDDVGSALLGHCRLSAEHLFMERCMEAPHAQRHARSRRS
jgi:Uma2 family endonuclease